MFDNTYMLTKLDEILPADLNVGVLNISDYSTIYNTPFNKEHFFQIKNTLFLFSHIPNVIFHEGVTQLDNKFFHKLTPWNVEIDNYIYVPYIGNLSNTTESYYNKQDMYILFYKIISDLLHLKKTIVNKNIYYVYNKMIIKYLNELNTLYNIKFKIDSKSNQDVVIYTTNTPLELFKIINQVKNITINVIRQVVDQNV